MFAFDIYDVLFDLDDIRVSLLSLGSTAGSCSSVGPSANRIHQRTETIDAEQNVLRSTNNGDLIHELNSVEQCDACSRHQIEMISAVIALRHTIYVSERSIRV